MSEPEELVVRQCNIRLVRRAQDGAHWLERDDHLQLARKLKPMLLAMLDDVVAPQLEALGPVSEDRLELKLRLPASLIDKPGQLLAQRLKQEGKAATAAAIKAARLRPSGAAPRKANAPEQTAQAPQSRSAHPLPILTAARTKAESGTLSAFVRSLEARALAELLGSLARELQEACAAINPKASGATERASHSAGGASEWREQAEALLRETLAAAPSDIASWDSEVITRITVSARQLAQLAAAIADELAQRSEPESAADLAQDKTPDPDTSPTADKAQSSEHSKADPAATRDTGEVTHDPVLASLQGRYPIECALPFLAIGRLMHHGIFDLVADVEAQKLLAYAIGLKVQGEPRNGRMWSADAKEAARLAAGLEEPLDGDAIAHASRNFGTQIEAAIAALNAAMEPAWLDLSAIACVRDGKRFFLFDPVGQYPAGGVSVDQLGDLLKARRATLVLPPGDAEGLEMLREVGWPALCHGTPSSGERFTQLTGPRGWQGMASVAQDALGTLPASWPRLSQAAFRAEALWEALTLDRRLTAAAAERDAATIELASAAIAGFALADIAYRLSRHNEAAWQDPDPLLTTERFADLNARIDVDAADVMVTLPLGRRFADLFEAGLLDAEHRLAWWGGRKLRIGGG